MRFITFSKKPKLNRPILIAGFEGWPNAGSISSDVLSFLKKGLGVKKFAEVNPDIFHKYSNNRPYAKIDGGEVKYLLFSPYEFFYKKGSICQDLILFLGKEPQLRWNQFTRSFLQLATDFDVSMLITIGGTYDYVTHKQAPWISGVVTDNGLKHKFVALGIKKAKYEGPVSIQTFLLQEAKKIGIKGINMWGHVPQYLTNNNFPTICQILACLKEIVGFDLDLSEIKLKSDELLKQIDLIVQKNPELSKYIEKIQKGCHLKKEPSFHEKVIQINDFLKKDPQ
jgi:proteasome assembly chaperone (PAC2) family protein